MNDETTLDPGWLAARLLAAAPVRAQLPADAAFHVLAALQLALRHPHYARSTSRLVVERAAYDLADALAERVPAARDLFLAGFDPARDVLSSGS